MSVYMTEDEQLELIKKWWNRYGNVITWALAALFLCIGGYRYYHWHQDKMKQQASTTYERMMNAFSNHDNKAVRAYASELIDHYGKSVYADAAYLTLAKIYTTKDSLDKAKEALQHVAQSSKMPALKQIAKIRIARILSANTSYDAALQELNVVDDMAYSAVINELKGDIYGAKGQYQEAVKAYRLAMTEAKTKGMGNLFLEMKTNELVVKGNVS